MGKSLPMMRVRSFPMAGMLLFNQNHLLLEPLSLDADKGKINTKDLKSEVSIQNKPGFYRAVGGA